MQQLYMYGHVARTRYMRNTYMALVVKPRRKRTCRINRCTYEDNIKMSLKIGCEGMDWIKLVQDRVHWPLLFMKFMNP